MEKADWRAGPDTRKGGPGLEEALWGVILMIGGTVQTCIGCY